MPFETAAAVLLLALAIDTAFGYPQALFDVVGHPVTWFGRVISAVDTFFNRLSYSFAARRLSGLLFAVALTGSALATGFMLQSILSSPWPLLILLAVFVSTLLASRSLFDHVADVAEALESNGLEGGRAAVGKIAGRDTAVLDEHGVARAAIESLAENASDGVVAPALWFLLLGLPGILAYKALNTADSMIGHRSEKYEAFGWAAAKLDDLFNLPASRLTAALFAAAACLRPDASAARALTAIARDARRHRSPNAGWPESAMAGALDLKLNGPRAYGGVMTNDGYMGDGRRDATAADIRRALQLALVAWWIMTGCLVLALVIAR